jgi:hypothetical protein
MEFEDIPDDLPDLIEVKDDSDYLVSLIEDIYNGVELTPIKLKEKKLEQRLISHLYQIAYNFDGHLDFSIPGIVFIYFIEKGLKPLNKYNFYFESGMIRCVNQINYHQKSSYFELIEDDINDITIVDDIIQFITSIPIIEDSKTKLLNPRELCEFSNPF